MDRAPKVNISVPSSPEGKLNGSWSEEEDARFLLRIVTHGRAHGPLSNLGSDTEHLRFSVRDIPNPSAKLRKGHTGLSARLRKELFGPNLTKARLEQITNKVATKMEEVEKIHARDESEEGYAKVYEEAIELVVDIECEEGIHRSVAFAEELGKSAAVKRPSWDIEIEHRDLGIVTNDTEEISDSEIVQSVHLQLPQKAKKRKDRDRKKVALRRGFTAANFSTDVSDA